MKKLMFAGTAIALMASMSGCSKVDYGNAAVKVDYVGGDRGINPHTYSSGYILYNPLTEGVFEFPTYQQSVTWTASKTEGSEIDESITFQSIESASCNCDVYVAYQFDANKIPAIVSKHKKTAQEITDTYIRGLIRDEFNKVAGTMKAIDIAGPGKSRLTSTVISNLNTRLVPEGIHLNDISIGGKVRLEKGIQQSIDRAVKATQDAIAAENKKREVQARADQEIIKAEGDKKAIEANPYYLEQKIIERWNGVLPAVVGSANNFNDVTKYVRK